MKFSRCNDFILRRLVALIASVVMVISMPVFALADADSSVYEDVADPELVTQASLGASSAAGGMTANCDKASGIALIQASVTGDSFKSLYVDGNLILNNIYSPVIYTTLDMKLFDVGYHTIRLYLTFDASTCYEAVVPTYVYDKPTSLGSFAVYPDYAEYTASGCNPAYDLYLDYSRNGRDWISCGPFNGTYRINGLTPDTEYFTRVYYGKKFSSGDKTYIFKGLATGAVIDTGVITTGKAKAPKVKSVKVKAVKVKKRKVEQFDPVTGAYIGSVKEYSYNLKVTVKLKKKPGTKGILINGLMCKGNKTTYTKTFGNFVTSRKPKGTKFDVAVCSYQDKAGRGLSPIYQKRKKVK